MWGCITDVVGLRVGLATDVEGITGVAVVRFDVPTVASVSVMGGAPGTFGTEALDPLRNNQDVHAVVLTGGSVFGLEAVHGVIRCLEEDGIGLSSRSVPIPIVAGAVLFDLALGSPYARPGTAMGFSACRLASREPVACGNRGPGAGATTGKWRLGRPLKGGLGAASVRLSNGIVVGALVAVNAVGDVINPASGRFYAHGGSTLECPSADVTDWDGARGFMGDPAATLSSAGDGHTTIGVVATNALLDKLQLRRMLTQAQHGLSRSIRPVHTSGDGDTLFGASVGGASRVDLGGVVTGVYSDVVGAIAADVVARAITRAMLSAETVGRWRSAVEVYPELGGFAVPDGRRSQAADGRSELR